MKTGLTLLVVFSLACATTAPDSTNLRSTIDSVELPAGVSFSPERIKAHMSFLADDLLEGRDTDSRGHDLAAVYVATRFEALGLEPAGDDGYLQQVTLRQSRTNHEASWMKFDDDGSELEGESDYYLSSNPGASEVDVTGDVVFVGYGITAPELEWNDYAGVDVRGKVVAYYRGAPGGWPSTPQAVYGSTSGKIENAREHGAIGIVGLRSPESYERTSWDRQLRWKDRPSTTWASADGRTGSSLGDIFYASLSEAGTRKLFESSTHTWETTVEAANNDEQLSFDMNRRVSVHLESTMEDVSSPNVIGRIPGTDLEAESILIVAHLDHVGINSRAEEGEDAIHNGAYDNASGIATMLETARAFASSNERPRRSIIFAAVTAEEKGLIGSDFLANNPTEATSDVVAAISIDMFLMLYPMNDVVGFGAEHSSIGPSLEKVATKMGVKLSPDYAPEMRLFVRTDHYPFVKRGIPGLFLVHGIDASPAENGREIMDAWEEERYHDADDDMDQPIDFQVGADFAQINYLLARELANNDEPPRWNPGNFFDPNR